jgi:hypothetical protein
MNTKMNIIIELLWEVDFYLEAITSK